MVVLVGSLAGPGATGLLVTGEGAAPPAGIHVVISSPRDGAAISMGVFFPTIEGCDFPEWVDGRWSSEVEPACRVPVVMDAGPYFNELTFGPVTSSSAWTEEFLPRDYAVAHLSVRGTGWSGGCFDYMGVRERTDLDHAVTFLGKAPWSNGRVGMIGISYDGSTPWELAAARNSHLAAIVPIEGISNLGKLYFPNGTSEGRAQAAGLVYTGFGAAPHLQIIHTPITAVPPLSQVPVPDLSQDPVDDHLLERACPDVLENLAHVAITQAHGSPSHAPSEAFWQERDFESRVLENYRGGVFLVHGFRDDNVEPTMAFPLFGRLQDAGISTRGIFGQWNHTAPMSELWPELRPWLDHHLKGSPAPVGPPVLLQSGLGLREGGWREEASWPPRDVQWTGLHPSADGRLVPSGATGRVLIADAGLGLCGGPTGAMGCQTGPAAVFRSEPVTNPLTLAGLPQLHALVTPSGPQGYLHARLLVEHSNGTRVALTTAVMDLRYAHGGSQPQEVAPGVPLLARMEFLAQDVPLAAGDRVVLEISQEVRYDAQQVLPNPSTAPLYLELDEDATTLRLPFVFR